MVCAWTFGSRRRLATPNVTRHWRCCGGSDAAASTPRSVAGDKGYCLGDFPQRVVDLRIRPHLAIPDNASARSPTRRFCRSAGYKISQVIRKRVEEIFGWGKTVGGLRKTRLKGREKTWTAGYWIMAAYNLTRMARLLRATPA